MTAINFGFPEGVRVTMTALGTTLTVPEWGREPDEATPAMTLAGGRVHTLEETVVRPSKGLATQRTDGRTTLNLLDVKQPQIITADTPTGPVTIQVQKATQARGWPSGEHYVLETDADGLSVVEPGRNHRKVYISGSPSALTKASIAAHATAAGTATTEAQVTGAWLVSRPQYGSTPEMAVTRDVAQLIAEQIIGSGKDPRSDHYLYECSYTYVPVAWGLSGQCITGESTIHPLYFGSWGAGPAPVMLNSWSLAQYGYGPKNVVVSNLDFPMFYFTRSINVLVEKGNFSKHENQITTSKSITLNQVKIYDVFLDRPRYERTVWEKSGDRVSGIYVPDTTGLYILGSLVDHCGWADNFDFNMRWNNGEFGHPPGDQSHNLYIDYHTFDVTLRGNMLSRGAGGHGAMTRGSSYMEGNAFIDNNIPFVHSGGDYRGRGPMGNFAETFDNVMMSAGYRVASAGGAYNWGPGDGSRNGVHLGNILAHAGDPNNPGEASKTGGTYDLTKNGGVTDMQVYGWGSTDLNVEGLDPAVLEATTAQKYAAHLLSKSAATIGDFVDHLKDPAVNPGEVVADFVAWTKGRFGRPMPSRTAPADLRFVPDDRTDGFRWDNRRNWSTLDLPGRNVADTVHLGGNYVKFGCETTDIAALTSGGGLLDVTSGKLTAGVLLDEANAVIRDSGQLWVGASAHRVNATADSGRLAFTGAMADLDIHARGNAEVLLGPDATIKHGQSLIVSGSRNFVGWNGSGAAALNVGGTLDFRTGAMVMLKFDASNEDILKKSHLHLYPGAVVRGESSGFTGRVAEMHRWKRSTTDTHRLWLCDIVGTPEVGELIYYYTEPDFPTDGSFETAPGLDHKATVASVTWQAPQLRRFKSRGDEPEPTVAVTVNLGLTAQIIPPQGLPPGPYDLTGQGITVVNNGAVLPAGVAVTGGKLILTV